MFAFVASFFASPVSWSDYILDIYDYLQELPVFKLVLPPILSTRHIHVFAVLPEPKGNRDRVAVPVHLQPSVGIALSGIRAMQVSGRGSSLETAVDAFIRRYQQINFPEDTQFPQNGPDSWQHWLGCRQYLNLVVSPFPTNSRWSWISRQWCATDFNLNVLYELARLASCETLNPEEYHLPVPFFRFATLVVVFHKQMHLIAKHVFGRRFTLVSDEAVRVRFLGSADEAFLETILGGFLVAEWTSEEHVGEFNHLHALLIRNTTLGKDYAPSLADVTRFVETVTTAGARTLTPLFLCHERESSTLEGGRIRTQLLEPIQNVIDMKRSALHEKKESNAAGRHVRTSNDLCHLYRTFPENLL